MRKASTQACATKKSVRAEATRLYKKYKYLSFPQRILQYSAVLFLRGIETIYPFFSRYGDPVFYDPKSFGWTAEFEENWETIRKELEKVLEYRESLPTFQDISQDDAYLTQDKQWKTFWLYNFGGVPIEHNTKRCPKTAQLLSEVPGLVSALFSILEPGKHIEPHRGPFKGIVRFLFALKIPEPREQVRIRVDSEIRTWVEGEFLSFDDTYEHEVWNDTDGIRVVLFMDVTRPLYFPLNLLNTILVKSMAISPKVRNMIQAQRKWDQTLQEAGFDQ